MPLKFQCFFLILLYIPNETSKTFELLNIFECYDCAFENKKIFEKISNQDHYSEICVSRKMLFSQSFNDQIQKKIFCTLTKAQLSQKITEKIKKCATFGFMVSRTLKCENTVGAAYLQAQRMPKSLINACIYHSYEQCNTYAYAYVYVKNTLRLLYHNLSANQNLK